MSRIQTVSLAALLNMATLACTVRVPTPEPPQLTIQLKAKTPQPGAVEVRSNSQGTSVDASAALEVEVENQSQARAPVDWQEPVALYGAPVVEFFGIPIEGSQDIVFVLDRSGSMDELALGAIAQLAAPAPAEYDPVGPPTHSGGPAPMPLDSGAAPVPPEEPPSMQPPLPDAPPPLATGPMPVAQGPRKIDVAHIELVDALERLPAGTRMNLLFFNDRLEAVQAGITALEENTRSHVISFVRETVPWGPTALAPAMRTAFLMKAKRIVLLSDGLGNVGGDAQSVLRDAREAMRGGVRIDTIGLGQDQDVWLLRQLAEESGGIYQRL